VPSAGTGSSTGAHACGRPGPARAGHTDAALEPDTGQARRPQVREQPVLHIAPGLVGRYVHARQYGSRPGIQPGVRLPQIGGQLVLPPVPPLQFEFAATRTPILFLPAGLRMDGASCAELPLRRPGCRHRARTGLARALQPKGIGAAPRLAGCSGLSPVWPVASAGRLAVFQAGHWECGDNPWFVVGAD
jgi:hypothetical protein